MKKVNDLLVKADPKNLEKQKVFDILKVGDLIRFFYQTSKEDKKMFLMRIISKKNRGINSSLRLCQINQNEGKRMCKIIFIYSPKILSLEKISSTAHSVGRAHLYYMINLTSKQTKHIIN